MTNTEPVQKQKTNVYTVMLMVSFLALVIACVLLFLELKEYGSYPWWDTSGATPTMYHPASDAGHHGMRT